MCKLLVVCFGNLGELGLDHDVKCLEMRKDPAPAQGVCAAVCPRVWVFPQRVCLLTKCLGLCKCGDREAR